MGEPNPSNAPHSSTFLLGASRQVRHVVASNAVADRGAREALKRVADALERLAVIWRTGPAVMETLQSQQVNLLRSTIGRMQELAIALPADASAAATESAASTEFLRIAAAEGACLRALAGQADKPHIAELFVLASHMEIEAHRLLGAEQSAILGEAASSPGGIDEQNRVAPTAGTLKQYLCTRFPAATNIDVSNVNQLRGANSKDIILFDVSGITDWPTAVVMRRMRPYGINEKASMPYEFRLLTRLKAEGLLVPRHLLLEDSSAPLEQPFLIMERVIGTADSAAISGSQLKTVVPQIAFHLAKIHQIDPLAVGARDDKPGASIAERLRQSMHEYYGRWTRLQLDPSPTIERAFVWLRDNMFRVSDVRVLVHGDFDLRNILVADSRITAILDWERSHIGHPAEDLVYCVRDVERTMDMQEFTQLYRANGGPNISSEEMEYFLIWSQMTRCVGSSQVKDAFLTGRHSDFLFASYGIIEYPDFITRLSQLLDAAALR